MKVVLLANQPENTIRLKLFGATLKELGYGVIIPRFSTKNWLSIARQSRDLIERERPDILHIFNVPDILYRKIPPLKRRYFKRMIYDYRSPWGIEYSMNIGAPGRWIGEHYERVLANSADAITTVNSPLQEKVQDYLDGNDPIPCIIPNYPLRSFSSSREEVAVNSIRPVLFVGRVCTQEGIGNLLRVAAQLDDLEFQIVGDGPFGWFFRMRMTGNVAYMGWQDHDKVAEFIARAGLCLIPREENALSPFSTDRSIWKLNEYLNLGKIVVASGITAEEARKNLFVVQRADLVKAVADLASRKPLQMAPWDYRYWDNNRDLIRSVYEELF